MALNFPENKGILETGANRNDGGLPSFVRGPGSIGQPLQQRDGGSNLRNRLSRVWHGYFEAIHKKFAAVEALTNISTADMGAAGATYSQTEMQKQNDLINELKAKVNALENAIKT